jgi:hypothetical protein
MILGVPSLIAVRNRDGYLLLLTLAGSALCWWPAVIEPSIDFPRWSLLVLIALMTALSVLLSERYWLRFVIAAGVGSFGGMWSGFILFPSSDGIANSYAPIAIGIATVAVGLVSFLAGLVARRISIFRKNNGRLAWLALMCCVASGPLAFALTSPWVAHRVAENDRVAAQRFTSLKAAVERTVPPDGDPADICQGRIVMQRYSGPPFSNEDWERITGNYVKQNGYLFMIYCHERGGYTIDALPARGKADGTRHFCTDESRRSGCGMKWNGSRHTCMRCTE